MSKRIFYPLSLLLIPVIGMLVTDDIHWSSFDFIIMGSLLFCFGVGIELVNTRVKHVKKRLLYLGILVLMFLLIWAELAVGIFGTPYAGS